MPGKSDHIALMAFEYFLTLEVKSHLFLAFKMPHTTSVSEVGRKQKTFLKHGATAFETTFLLKCLPRFASKEINRKADQSQQDATTTTTLILIPFSVLHPLIQHSAENGHE